MKLFVLPGKLDAEKLEKASDSKAKPQPVVDEQAVTLKPPASAYIMLLGWMLIFHECFAYLEFLEIFGRDYNFNLIFRLFLPEYYNTVVVILLAFSHFIAIDSFVDALSDQECNKVWPMMLRITNIIIAKAILVLSHIIAIQNDDKETVSTFVKRGTDFFVSLKNSSDIYDEETLAQMIISRIEISAFFNVLNLTLIVVVYREIRRVSNKNVQKEEILPV